GIRPRAEPDLFEHAAHALGDVATPHAAQHQRQADIVGNAAVGEQAVVLVDNADIAPVQGNTAAAHLGRLRSPKSTAPRLARSLRWMSLSSVLLPAPEWPVMKSISPVATSKLTS